MGSMSALMASLPVTTTSLDSLTGKIMYGAAKAQKLLIPTVQSQASSSKSVKLRKHFTLDMET